MERVIVDPSAASFLAALRQAGFPVKAADNRVLDGIRVTAGMLREGRIVLCEPCEDCLREMGSLLLGEREGGAPEGDTTTPWMKCGILPWIWQGSEAGASR